MSQLTAPACDLAPDEPKLLSVVFGDYKITPWYSSPGYLGPNKQSSASSKSGPHGREPAIIWRENTHYIPETHSLDRIYVCDYCFKYCGNERDMVVHRGVCTCRVSATPGRLVYDDQSQFQIYEVDGEFSKLYCQCLSLFAKMFLESKSVIFAVEGFWFYIVVDRKTRHPMGFFSKEKNSWDEYNLACILVFPPFQSHGLGRLLIAFSYYLSRLSSTVSSPEKPLSLYGHRSYLSYWCLAVSQYLLGLRSTHPLKLAIDTIAQATGIESPDVVVALKAMDALIDDTIFMDSVAVWAAKHGALDKCLLNERYCMY